MKARRLCDLLNL